MIMIPLLNTKATIEHYGKGKICDIIFRTKGDNGDFYIIDVKKTAEEYAEYMHQENETITMKNVEECAEYLVSDIKEELINNMVKYLKEQGREF